MVGSRLAPILVLAIMVWNVDAEHLKSRVHSKMQRLNLGDFKNLRREAKGKLHSRTHHFMGKHSALMIDQDDVIKKKHMEFTYAKQCSVECARHEVCVKHTGTGNTKCVHKKFLKESRQLSRFNKRHRKGGKRHNHLMKEQRGFHGKYNHLESRVKELDERPNTIRNKQLKAMKKTKKHNRDFLSQHQLIENMDAVDELMHMGEGSQTEISRKYPQCVNKIEEIKRRLNGWFVSLHTQKKEHRSKKYRMNHSQIRKPKHFGDFRTFGQCNCGASVMWERRSLDKDGDTYLTNAELAILEDIHEEKCITPLLESCDTDKDKMLSKKEWCCCFTDTEAPCFKHLEKDKIGTNDQGYKPRCTTEGFYEKTQCDPTGKVCWCSDLDGNHIANTKILGNPHCERFDSAGRPVREL
ncbi:testican-2-like [Mizuhopecten yessoensis]|uniref:Testican-2 n=1 Tax=Mizuhopecten yessoensis TaxID=6573 RepID=A0A210QT18_MIZYE|nr:testican-2-like [Mizuhopecten yessoensis]OWF51859.1 Testican-2 [Mizuhopecten yessoensis]